MSNKREERTVLINIWISSLSVCSPQNSLLRKFREDGGHRGEPWTLEDVDAGALPPSRPRKTTATKT